MIAVDALLFDLDGTLVDSKRDLARSVQHLQKHYGVTPSSEAQVAAFIGDGVVKLVTRSLPDLAMTQVGPAVAAFKRFYREHCVDHTRLYPGVLRTLKYFRRKKMAVVTNKPVRVSEFIIDQLGMSCYFAVVVGGDSLPNKKPHPAPIRHALKTMGLGRRERAVVIGDSPNDVDAGRAAGIYTCGIRSNISDPKKLFNSRPDFAINKMDELMRIFN